MKAELVPENGDPPIPIVRDVTVVGRREYCDVVIDHRSLSKRHCVLVKTDGLLVIRDLATTNGTKVKGQKVRWAALLPDDRISLGAYKLRVYLGPDDMPSPSEQQRARVRVEGPLSAGIPRGDAIPGRPVAGTFTAWPEPVSTAPLYRPIAAPGFPEPSHSGTTGFPDSDQTLALQDRRSPAPMTPAHPEFQFEILEDDDDEIIDLE
jgi:predicted component of type VI protein secretion system